MIRPAHILLLDHDRQCRDLIGDSFTDQGILAIFHSAGNVGEAMSLVDHARNAGLDLHLLIMEISLPTGGAFAFMSWAQQWIPRTLVHAWSAEMSDVRMSFQCGADSYLWKRVVWEDYTQVAKVSAELLEMPATVERRSPEVRQSVPAPVRPAGGAPLVKKATSP